MLKTTTVTLSDRGQPQTISLIELPALVADRYARVALATAGLPQDGGVVALTYAHMSTILTLGERSTALLQPFVQADQPVRGWRNVLALQQAALALHTSFLIGRPRIEIPVGMLAGAALHGAADLAVHFCSPAIAAVLHSGRATYRELETDLSTEDAYNLAELVNVEAIREWHAHQSAKSAHT